MSAKIKYIIAFQIMVSFILFMFSTFVFFTEQDTILCSQMLFASYIIGVSSIVVFKIQYEMFRSVNKLTILWIIGVVFSVLGMFLNIGIRSFGITIFIIALIMSCNFK